MKQLACLFIIFIAIGCSTKSETEKTEKETANETEKEIPEGENVLSELNGIWIPAMEEFGGTMIPETNFANQTLIINDSIYEFTAESVDIGVLKYGDGKMDIYGKDGVNAGKHFRTIYKLENDELTICYNLNGDNYPEAFETKGNPMYFLAVFKREK